MQIGKSATASASRRFSLRHVLRGAGRGQSLAEFALVLPFLLILTLGVIDYGRVYFAYVSVTNGARNGADYAASGPGKYNDTDGIRDAALTETSELLNTSATNPTVTIATGTDAQGDTYTDVTMTYTSDSLFPWPGLPNSIDIERTVRARAAE